MSNPFTYFNEGIGGLANTIASHRESCKEDLVVYRGQKGDKPILPSVLREPKWAENEDKMLRRLEASFPDEFLNDSSTMDKLARARHVNFPTRLLDVTTNPLVATYFAAKQSAGNHGVGEVIAFRIKEEKERFFNSDTISCIANLSYLTYDEKKNLALWLKDNASRLKDNKGKPPADVIRRFNNLPYIKRLVQFIKMEKPYFHNRIDPSHIQAAWYVKPKMSTRRILAQSGAFLVFGNCPGKIGEDPPKEFLPEIKSFSIRKGESEKLLKDLEGLGIDERALFPDIETEARAIAKSP